MLVTVDHVALLTTIRERLEIEIPLNFGRAESDFAKGVRASAIDKIAREVCNDIMHLAAPEPPAGPYNITEVKAGQHARELAEMKARAGEPQVGRDGKEWP